MALSNGCFEDGFLFLSTYAFLPFYTDSPAYGLVPLLGSLLPLVSPQCSPLLVLTAAVSLENNLSVLQT